MEELERLNEALRKALSIRLYDEVDNSGSKGEHIICLCCIVFLFFIWLCLFNVFTSI